MNDSNKSSDGLEKKKNRGGKPASFWSEGLVDVEKDHIKLFYQEQPKPIALVFQDKKDRILVEFLTTSSEDPIAVERVTEELNFYFNEINNLFRWDYAIYHVGTAANMYSKVHWSYFPAGWKK